MVKLDLGCGYGKKQGFIGIDNRPLPTVDYVWDLNKGIPYEANSVEEIYSGHFFEHIGNGLPQLLKEIVRVCKNNAPVTVVVPYWSMEGAMFYGHVNTMPPLQFQQICGDSHANREFWFDINIGWLELLGIDYEYTKEGIDFCKSLGITIEEGAKFLNNIVYQMTVRMKVVKKK